MTNNTQEDIQKEINDGLYDSFIGKLAYLNWMKDNKPNGEEYRDSEFGRMRIREIHWFRAKEMVSNILTHHARMN